MHKDIGKRFICVQSDDTEEIYEEYLSKGVAVRYTWKGKPLPEMEVKFAKDALDEYQIETKTKLEFTGLPVWFSSINMNIAFKEHLLKSEKDIEDAKHLRKVYPEIVDEKEIEKIARMIKRYRL